MSTERSGNNNGNARNTRGQVLSLIRNDNLDRNRHLSPIITRIRDNGPALPEEEPAPAQRSKADWAMVEKAAADKQSTRESATAGSETAPPYPVTRETRTPLSLLLLITGLMACTVYYISTLHSRIDTLQQEVSVLHGKVEILQEIQD